MFMLAFCEYPHSCMSVVDLRVCAACGWLAAPLEFSGACVLLFGQLLFVLFYLSIYPMRCACSFSNSNKMTSSPSHASSGVAVIARHACRAHASPVYHLHSDVLVSSRTGCLVYAYVLVPISVRQVYRQSHRTAQYVFPMSVRRPSIQSDIPSSCN